MEIKIRKKIFFEVSCLCCLFFIFLYGCTPSEIPKPIKKTETPTATAARFSTATLTKSSTPLPTETPALIEQTEQAEEDHNILTRSLIFECDNEINRFDMLERNFTQLLHDTENMFYDLTWDGNDIFYTKSTKSMITPTVNMGITFGPNNIYKVKIDGSDNACVINDKYNEQWVRVTSNSKFFVYQIITEENKLQLILFNPETGDQKIIWDEDFVEGETLHHFPYWSPDGTQIAILVYPNLYIYDLETEITTQLVSDQKFLDIQLAWSPDGKFIAAGIFNEDEVSGLDNYGIAMINTESREIEQSVPSENDFWPKGLIWSPDGKRIVFGETDRDNSRLVSWELASGEFFILHTGIGQEQVLDYHAVWSSDSESIAYFIETSESLLSLIFQDVKTQEILISEEILDSTGCYEVVDMLWIDTP